MSSLSLKNTIKNLKSKKISIKELNQEFIKKIKDKFNYFETKNIEEYLEYKK